MPDPQKFKNERSFMNECMHVTLNVEKKDRDQAIAQCINMWKNRSKGKKRALAEVMKNFCLTLNNKSK